MRQLTFSPTTLLLPKTLQPLTPFASESEANGEPFPIQKLPTPPAVKKEAAGDAALMRCTFAAPSYGPDMQPYCCAPAMLCGTPKFKQGDGGSTQKKRLQSTTIHHIR